MEWGKKSNIGPTEMKLHLVVPVFFFFANWFGLILKDEGSISLFNLDGKLPDYCQSITMFICLSLSFQTKSNKVNICNVLLGFILYEYNFVHLLICLLFIW